MVPTKTFIFLPTSPSTYACDLTDGVDTLVSLDPDAVPAPLFRLGGTDDQLLVGRLVLKLQDLVFVKRGVVVDEHEGAVVDTFHAGCLHSACSRRLSVVFIIL